MSQPLGEERRVVPFAAPPGRVRRRLVGELGGRGAVLLFTGVRYERASDGNPPALPHPGTPSTPDPRRGN